MEDSGGEIKDYKSFDFVTSQIYRNQPDYFYYYGITTMIISESKFNETFNANIDLEPDEVLNVENYDLNIAQEEINYDTYLRAQPYSEEVDQIVYVSENTTNAQEFLNKTQEENIQVFEFKAENTTSICYDFINSNGEIEFEPINATIVDDSIYNSINNPQTSTIQEFNVSGIDQGNLCINLKDELRNINDALNSWQQSICKSIKVKETEKAISMFGFIMVFISVLFLIASSVVLHYKLVNDIQYEKSQVALFTKIGVSQKESEKYIKIMLLLFSLPHCF